VTKLLQSLRDELVRRDYAAPTIRSYVQIVEAFRLFLNASQSRLVKICSGLSTRRLPVEKVSVQRGSATQRAATPAQPELIKRLLTIRKLATSARVETESGKSFDSGIGFSHVVVRTQMHA